MNRNNDTRFLVALYDRSKTSKEIADAFGYSDSTVRYHRAKRKILSKSRNLHYLLTGSIKQRKEAKRVLESMRIKDAAIYYQTTNMTIKNARKKLGITSQRNLHLNEQFCADAMNMRPAEVMAKWDVSLARVYQVRKIIKEQTNGDSNGH